MLWIHFMRKNASVCICIATFPATETEVHCFRIGGQVYWFRWEVLEVEAIVVAHVWVPIICKKRSIPVAAFFLSTCNSCWPIFLTRLIIWTLLWHCRGLHRGLLYNWTFIPHHRLFYFQDKIWMFHIANTATVNDGTSYILCCRVVIFPSAVWLPNLMVTWLSEHQMKHLLIVCSISQSRTLLRSWGVGDSTRWRFYAGSSSGRNRRRRPSYVLWQYDVNATIL